MGPVHVNPPEAVQIHQDLQSRYSIAMHWGTFRLADEELAEPPIYLKRALEEAGIDRDKFIIMKFGEILNF
jgi:N-acyl-phosphatidylethanolamine-hydrolysing phospholipase D